MIIQIPSEVEKMEAKTKLCYLFGLTLFLAILISGCQSDAPTTPASEEQPAAATSAPDEPAVISGSTGSFFSINEIGLGPEGYIALTNFTDVTVSTGGLILCQGEDCFALPTVEVAAGETALVAVGDGSGLQGVIATGATIGELRSEDGEIAIYASVDYDDPKAILVYLQWGSTPHELTDVAVEAGLWFETSYAPSSDNATRLFRVEESGLWLFEE
jgi:hypothetical protein